MAITDNQPVVQSIGMDGYGNPISVTRDEGAGVNRLLVSGVSTGRSHVRLFDEDGNPVTIVTDGSQLHISVRDEEQLSVMHLMLLELKKIRMHLQMMSEEEIDDTDVED